MACNCGKKNRKTFNPNPAPPPVPITERSIQPNSRQVGPQQETRCRVCGWMLKMIKYIDVSTGEKVSRTDCTNAKCTTRK